MNNLLKETFNQLSSREGNSYFRRTVEESQLIDWDEHVKTLDKEDNEKDLTQYFRHCQNYNFKGELSNLVNLPFWKWQFKDNWGDLNPNLLIKNELKSGKLIRNL